MILRSRRRGDRLYIIALVLSVLGRDATVRKDEGGWLIFLVWPRSNCGAAVFPSRIAAAIVAAVAVALLYAHVAVVWVEFCSQKEYGSRHFFAGGEYKKLYPCLTRSSVCTTVRSSVIFSLSCVRS